MLFQHIVLVNFLDDQVQTDVISEDLFKELSDLDLALKCAIKDLRTISGKKLREKPKKKKDNSGKSMSIILGQIWC